MIGITPLLPHCLAEKGAGPKSAGPLGDSRSNNVHEAKEKTMPPENADIVRMNASEIRQAEYPVHQAFLDRWSPRAMSGEPVAKEELMQLFEAAKWAPSSYNAQPWRFLYAQRDSADWPRFLGLLIEFNQTWAQHAAALVAVVSRTKFEHNDQPSVTHAFDAGAAWGYLALQGSLRGLVVHGMQGFDYQRARTELAIPDLYEVHAMIAIGKPGAETGAAARDAKTRNTQRAQAIAGNCLRGELSFFGGLSRWAPLTSQTAQALHVPSGIMPTSHTDRFHHDHNRDKREEELLCYDHASLEEAYKVVCQLPFDTCAEAIPAEALIASILAEEFGPAP